MNRRNGWIIYNGNLATEKFMDYVNWFQHTANKQNVHVDAIANNDLIVSIESGIGNITVSNEAKNNVKRTKHNDYQPLIKTIEGEVVCPPDFIHFADKDMHLAKQLEAVGIRLFNPASAIERCDNKAHMHIALAQKGLPVPKTLVAPKVYDGVPLNNATHINIICETLGFPFILKEAYGSFGQQVYWIESKEAFIEQLIRLGATEYICQEPIHDSYGMDIRLNVVGDKVVTAMKRTSKTDFRANVTAGGKTEPYEPTEEERALAIKAAHAVDADFAGVDLLIGKDGPVLCEVNSNPHLRSIYECTGVDVAEYMVDYIKEKTKKPNIT
ncbi:RimK family alpha-L-glutamate ligase [Bacillus shivajii]|uniref:ATP-grasp domain-containing protein n=1 Tax=Bacillus shivajii TaxID=1983719 RepID=UPI001CFB9513|nr:RimK family alpha-L-glutamate ligase [Bacillus shivajii]UCZ52105.1 RimK family alpha-L-glutamate ligase [Bacillus shivajii]